MINEIRTKERESNNLSEDIQTLLCLETERYLSWGTLIGVNTAKKTAFKIAEAKIENSNDEKALERHKIVSFDKIISRLSETKNISVDCLKKADYLCIISNEYSEVQGMKEVAEVERELFNSASKELGIRSSRLEMPAPSFAGNEIKSRSLVEGFGMMEEDYSNLDSKVFIDFSYPLSGYISEGNSASSGESGLLVGYGGSIFDSIFQAQDHGDLGHGDFGGFQAEGEVYEDVVEEAAGEIVEELELGRVRAGTERVGDVPVNVPLSYENDLVLIGSDEKTTGKSLTRIGEIGRRVSSFGEATANKLIHRVFLRFIGRIIRVLHEERLMGDKTGIFLSGHYLPLDNKLDFSEYLSGLGFGKPSVEVFHMENFTPFGVLSISPKFPEISTIEP